MTTTGVLGEEPVAVRPERAHALPAERPLSAESWSFEGPVFSTCRAHRQGTAATAPDSRSRNWARNHHRPLPADPVSCRPMPAEHPLLAARFTAAGQSLRSARSAARTEAFGILR